MKKPHLLLTVIGACLITCAWMPYVPDEPDAGVNETASINIEKETISPAKDILPHAHAIGSVGWRTQPEMYTIQMQIAPPFESLSMTLDNQNWVFNKVVEREEYGRKIWRGQAHDGSFLVFMGDQNNWTGLLTSMAGEEYDLQGEGSSVSVTRRISVANCAVANAVDGGEEDLSAFAVAEHELPSNAETANVDVAFFYDRDMLDHYQGDVAKLEDWVLLTLETGNAALEGSGIYDFRWRFCGVHQLPDAEVENTLEGCLRDFSTTTTTIGAFAGKVRTLTGVDQVMYLKGKSTDEGTSGIAWLGSGYSVIIAQSSALIMAHELAHNFGCKHVREEYQDVGGYGYGYVFNKDGGSYGTVVTNGFTRVPYFSSPTINYGGTPVGIAYPASNAADNSRRLREMSQVMAASRVETDAPVIIKHPQNSFKIGEAFELTVGVRSKIDYTCQWYKDGAPIANATSLALTRAGTVQDGGVYYAQIRNAAAVVNSEPIKVTGYAGQNPGVTSGSTGDSGGGGGGAPSLLYLTSIAVLGLYAYKRGSLVAQKRALQLQANHR